MHEIVCNIRPSNTAGCQTHVLSIQTPYISFFMEKDLCRGAVYLIVLCDHPSLVSVLFAVLLPLHLVTF